MKTKSNMTDNQSLKSLIKLKEKEFDKKFWYVPVSKGDFKGATAFEVVKIREYLSQSIQEAYALAVKDVNKELQIRVDTWGGFEDDGGNLAHYDEEILEWLQSLPKKETH